MQNADGSKFCRFCGTALMQSSGTSQPRTPYSWQSEDFKADNEQTRNQDPRHTRIMSPPPPPQQQPTANYPQRPPQSPQMMMQPMGAAPLYQYPGQQTMQHNPYGHMYCPNCRTQVIPHLERKISQAGWIVFAVMMIGFFPLFWIGLLIKEDQRFCPICRTRVG
jgi:hypothetical protein